ncbi:MAG: tRNA (adenosine(37)-N6)-threonylcarbamoyltransferase complex dimerization subunit type 1 TsaB [Bacteroidota bacterium]|nr:tRNA (adenosine(37)-N6)-threonylcarbamoyltransferase complex dimerization subunit type 1 TsaB [Bacteroidota bacterium]
MILAIETATEVCSTALVHNGVLLGERSLKEKNIHSERLLLLVDEVLKSAQVKNNQLEAIAVSIGPGSFTGLRIGISTAKGLALALDIPIIAVPTLDGIAESYRRSRLTKENENFCSLIEAKREEAFFAFFLITQNDIILQSEYAIKLKEEIMIEGKSRNSIIDQPSINASSIGFLAERKKKEFELSDFLYLEPLYLRDFVATLPKKI